MMAAPPVAGERPQLPTEATQSLTSFALWITVAAQGFAAFFSRSACS